MLNRIQKGTNVYAEYPLTKDVVIDNNSLMMINANRENGTCFAAIQIEENDGVTEKMLFDVTSMISMEEYLGEYISQDEFKLMISNLIDAIEKFDEYMIDLRQVRLQLDTVFINKLNNRVSFLCFALREIEQPSDIYAFFYELVTKCKVRVTVNETSYWHCVLNIVQNKNGFSLQNMRDAMASLSGLTGTAEQYTMPKKETAVPLQEVKNNDSAPIPFDESSTITISSQPVMPLNASAAIPMPEATEKKGLFGGLFGGKKRNEKTEKLAKNAVPEKSDMKAKSAKAVAPKSGLANRLATDSSKRRVVRGEDVPLNMNVVQPPSAPMMPPPSQQPDMDFGGTTVLRDSSQQPAVPVAPAVPTIAPLQAGMSPFANPAIQPEPFPQQPVQNSGSISFGASTGTSAPLPVIGAQQDIESCNTTILRDTENVETTVLRHRNAFLLCLRNNQKIMLDNPVTRFGRDRNDLDYDMHWNTNVGHLHANIVEKAGKYYLVDLNSRNHSYINQMPVAPQQENQLCDRDIIELADEKFQFFEQ